MAALGTRNSAPQQHQPTLSVDTNDLEILLGTRHRAHVARHALARKHATRILGHADGARNIVRTRVAVGGALRLEVVALDGARKALALRHTGDVHLLPGLEQLDRHCGTRLIPGSHVGRHAKFAQQLARVDTRLGEMARFRFVDTAIAAAAIGELHRGITVVFWRAHLRDTVVGHFQHRHRNGRAALGENAGHADLAANEPDTHLCISYLKPAASAADEGCRCRLQLTGDFWYS